VPPTQDALLRDCHVAFFSWRDGRNPEGGGAERYLEKVAAGLVARGCRVTIFTVAYAGAAPDEVVDGVRYVRRGSKLSVYLLGVWALLRRRLGRVDVVVDVQNGLPFFTSLATRKPVIVLVHHVHREQWPVVYPGLFGKVGWWIESRLAPRLYRGRQYVVVSRATRAELRELGVTGPRVAVVHNGTDPVVSTHTNKTPYPSICVVGRLVPHKQVEHAIDAARALVAEFPDLRVRIVGDGWWETELHAYAADLTERGTVVFEGHVSELRKQEIYEESWVMALPSLKEGWGLVVGEAAAHRTPTVAYRSAGGTRESIVDGVTGVLVDTPGELASALGALLRDDQGRQVLAKAALEHSYGFTWEHSQAAFAHVVASARQNVLVTDQDVVES
jgi:glycosyltransferase involved in cell wall biosynthesis